MANCSISYNTPQPNNLETLHLKDHPVLVPLLYAKAISYTHHTKEKKTEKNTFFVNFVASYTSTDLASKVNALYGEQE